jgi:hypothetical protein
MLPNRHDSREKNSNQQQRDCHNNEHLGEGKGATTMLLYT